MVHQLGVTRVSVSSTPLPGYAIWFHARTSVKHALTAAFSMGAYIALS